MHVVQEAEICMAPHTEDLGGSYYQSKFGIYTKEWEGYNSFYLDAVSLYNFFSVIE